MKKLILCLVAFGVAFSLDAQFTVETLSETGGTASSGSRTILCPPGSIYSHEISYYNAISSMEGHAIYWDQIETAPGAPISQVVFYGIANGTPDRNYTINFYHNNEGIPGTLFSSHTEFIAGVNTGEILFDKVIYSYTYNLPSSLVFSAGDWISVIAANGDMWYWLNGSGGDGCVYNNFIGEWCDLGDVAFCLLGGLGGNEVPVSPWALGIGIALIMAAVILRYRRVM
jgi:hypothetical protein